MRGYQNVIKVNQIPKVELAPTAPDHQRLSGGCAAVPVMTSVRDRLEHAESTKRDEGKPAPESETAKLMRAYARANARAESEEKARQEIWAQRAAERDRANQIDLTKAKQQLFRSMDAYDIIEPVMALVRSWKRETSIDAYRVAIEQVRRKSR